MKRYRFILNIASWILIPGFCYASPEGFEDLQSGALTRAEIKLGTITSDEGHAEIISGKAQDGAQSLRLLGGKNRAIQLTLNKSLPQGGELIFWAERWTRQGPFSFQVEEEGKEGWKVVYQGGKKVTVGGYNVQVRAPLAKGTKNIRISATTPDGSGVMMDGLDVQPAKPMSVQGAVTIQPVIPALVRVKDNQVLGLVVNAKGSLDAKSVTSVKLNTTGTTTLSDVKAIRLFYSGTDPKMQTNQLFCEEAKASESLTFSGSQKLTSGPNYFWVSFEMKHGADIDGRVDAGITELTLDDGQLIQLENPSPKGTQRIGYAVTQPGDGNSKTFRIPGLATTNKGTLIGVYDMRYNHGHDLPGDIDVAMSRSTNGGQTWEKLKVIMNMGNDPRWRFDGIGDPSVLVDQSNNRIWVAATWSHGNRSWRGSGKGMTPEETGQFILVYSDDDGITWSEPVNITEQIKKPEWHFILEGPGKGITLKDGTLVFPAQFQDETAKRMPFSTLIYSKDQGKTWHCGSGVKSNTTEAQLVELEDGSVMINCRDNRGGFRTIATTVDLGATWTLHPTDRKALNEPTCMASLIRVEHKEWGDLLVFSNPNTPRQGKPRGRYDMSLKVSSDEGMTWPEKWHTLYDVRSCAGYSCLSMVGEDKVGVLYEGPKQLYYLRFSLKELIQGK